MKPRNKTPCTGQRANPKKEKPPVKLGANR